MSSKAINTQLVDIALDKVEGFPFERFANEFFAHLIGTEFVPIGGVGDGGADAALAGLRVDKSRPTTFFQVSVQRDERAKIRATVKRLREVERTVDHLIFITSQSVAKVDLVERELAEELGCGITIRDARYITSHINEDDATRQAFDTHLRHYTDYLKSIGASTVPVSSKHSRSPAVYVFLQQEIERRDGITSLSDAVVDSLVLWSLEGTDPDTGLLMSRDDIFERILDEMPHAKALLETGLDKRLAVLRSKKGGHERGVRWHKKEDRYVLPFETRRHIEEENVSDEQLRIEVLRKLEVRTTDAIEPGDRADVLARAAAEVALRAVQRMFECEGLELAHFVSAQANGNTEATTGDEAVRFALTELGVAGADRATVGLAAESSIRGAFYHSSEEERSYFAKLSKTYSLFFVMAAEPRIIEYFQDLAGDFDSTSVPTCSSARRANGTCPRQRR